MADLKIREFQETDESDLIGLIFEFGEYLKNCDKDKMDLLIVPSNYGQKFYTKMVEDVKKKNGKIFIVEDNQKVVGFIAGVILEVGKNDDEFDCKPHRMGRVTDLFLNKEYRGIGYGSKLMETMQDFFKENNCYKINIEVFGPNVNSYNFYKKHGYSDRNIDLAKVI